MPFGRETSADMTNSEKLFERGCRVLPGGVNSPVRAFRAVGGTPRFIVKGLGSHILDADGLEYIDYVGSWGPMILGHSHPDILKAVYDRMVCGLSFGAPTGLEVEMAEKMVSMLPGVEMVRMVNSGTEAVMSAVRLARGATGRDKIIKFEGCYHGHSDAMLVGAGSGALTQGEPDSKGVTKGAAQDTLMAQYNDLASVERLLEANDGAVAAVIVEPVAANMGVVPPEDGFLQGLRTLCDRHGALLIFDEVITGFRLAAGGAQEYFGVQADLVTYGKIIGGGMPVAAFGGKRDIMNCVAPLGPVYQAGTLSGNPVAVACGLATLHEIQQPGFYKRLSEQTAKLVKGLGAMAKKHGVAFSAQSIGGMFGIYFRGKCPTSFKEVMECDADRFKTFFHAMLDNGVYLAPSIYEAGFVSITHDDSVIARTLEAADKAFAEVKRVHG